MFTYPCFNLLHMLLMAINADSALFCVKLFHRQICCNAHFCRTNSIGTASHVVLVSLYLQKSTFGSLVLPGPLQFSTQRPLQQCFTLIALQLILKRGIIIFFVGF